ncbi:MAG TPA: barstar family protein [Terriglobales bacterium]|jgi:hypothetical protein|nr:barstar family protein [Terriglobales bacterium]
MSIFSGDPSEWQRVDWKLLQNGPIALYFSPTVLSGDVHWLRDHEYDVYEFNCEHWTSSELVHNDFKQVLQFPDYYGSNFDALSDCLSDLQISSAGGAVFVFNRYDSYAKSVGAARSASGRTHAEIILDIIAEASRFFLLTRIRLLALVQSDDPRIQFERIGCTPVLWNPQEWRDKKRGL